MCLAQNTHPENVPLNDLDVEEDFDDIDIEEEHESNGWWSLLHVCGINLFSYHSYNGLYFEELHSIH